MTREEVVLQNGVRISYVVVDSADEIFFPGDTLFTTWYNDKGQWIKDQFRVSFYGGWSFINEYYYDDEGHMIHSIQRRYVSYGNRIRLSERPAGYRLFRRCRSPKMGIQNRERSC